MSLPPNGSSIGSAVIAQLTHVCQTHRHRDHATCDMLKKRAAFTHCIQKQAMRTRISAVVQATAKMSQQILSAIPVLVLKRRVI